MNTALRIVPALAGVPFFGVGALGWAKLGAHPMLIGFSALGFLGLATSAYYCLFRIQYDSGHFILRPGSIRYRVDQVTRWRVGLDSDAERGAERHLKLTFGPWWKTYVLFEEEIGSAAFDSLLDSLKKIKMSLTMRWSQLR